jgi:hypothetical protein
MNTTMTNENLKRFGIEATDVPEIWERFDEFKHGLLRDPEEQEHEEDDAGRSKGRRYPGL